MFSKQYLNKEKLNYRWELWDEIKRYLEDHITEIKEHHPEIYLRYLMIGMLDFSDDLLLTEYLNTLLDPNCKLNRNRLAVYYSDFYNYLTMRISRGEHKFRGTLGELFKTLDSKDLLGELNGRQITYYTFKQVVDTCIYLYDLEWLRYFLEKYSSHINDPHRRDISNLAYAKFYYYSGDFNKARLALDKVGTKDFIHYLDAKLLLTGIEYDAENYVEIFEIFSAVKKYLKSRRDIPQEHSESTNRYICYLVKLIRVAENIDGENAEFELDAIESSLKVERGNMYAKTWLENRISALKKRQHH
jgi:hypothetical protein